MYIQFFADIHSARHLPPISPSADTYILLGDVSSMFFWAISDFLATHPEKRNAFHGILGNHDDGAYIQNYPWIRWHNYNDTEIISGVTIGFLPWQDAPEPVAFERPVDIVVSHAPVRGIGDDSSDEAHTGVTHYLTWLEKNTPQHWFFGHMHQETKYHYMETVLQCVYGSYIAEI